MKCMIWYSIAYIETAFIFPVRRGLLFHCCITEHIMYCNSSAWIYITSGEDHLAASGSLHTASGQQDVDIKLYHDVDIPNHYDNLLHDLKVMDATNQCKQKEQCSGNHIFIHILWKWSLQFSDFLNYLEINHTNGEAYLGNLNLFVSRKTARKKRCF